MPSYMCHGAAGAAVPRDPQVIQGVGSSKVRGSPRPLPPVRRKGPARPA